MAGLEVVAQRQSGGALAPLVGEVVGTHLVGTVVHEHRRSEVEQVGSGAALLLPPGVEVGTGDHVGGHTRVVEVEERLLVHHDVAATRTVLELLGLLQEPAVGLEEPVPGVPLPLHQRVPDEQHPGDAGW